MVKQSLANCSDPSFYDWNPSFTWLHSIFFHVLLMFSSGEITIAGEFHQPAHGDMSMYGPICSAGRPESRNIVGFCLV